MVLQISRGHSYDKVTSGNWSTAPPEPIYRGVRPSAFEGCIPPGPGANVSHNHQSLRAIGTSTWRRDKLVLHVPVFVGAAHTGPLAASIRALTVERKRPIPAALSVPTHQPLKAENA